MEDIKKKSAVLQCSAARETAARAALRIKDSLLSLGKTLCTACRDLHAQHVDGSALVDKRAPAALFMHHRATRFVENHVVPKCFKL